MPSVHEHVSLGQLLVREEVEGLRFERSLHRAGRVLPPHAHQHANVLMVVRGGLLQTIGRDAHSIGAGGVVAKGPGVVHSDHFGGRPTELFGVEVFPERLESLATKGDPFRRPLVVHESGVTALVRALLDEFATPDQASQLALEALALELVSALRTRQSHLSGDRPPTWLRAVRDRLDEQVAERHDLTTLADAAGVHPAHLARAFKRWLGRTPGGYLRERRLEEAARLLATTDREIVDIALDLGFYDQAHFTRVFRRPHGLTPARFRRVCRRGPLSCGSS